MLNNCDRGKPKQCMWCVYIVRHISITNPKEKKYKKIMKCFKLSYPVYSSHKFYSLPAVYAVDF